MSTSAGLLRNLARAAAAPLAPHTGKHVRPKAEAAHKTRKRGRRT